MTRVFLCCVVALGLVAATPAPATAHAIILESSPAPNQVVNGDGIAVRLRFNSRIDRRRSRLELLGPQGGGAALPIAEESAPDRLSAALDRLPPGDYRLRWQVLAIDGHITRGDIPFRVDSR